MGLLETDDCLQRERSVRLDLLICCLRIDGQRLESETIVTGSLRGDADVYSGPVEPQRSGAPLWEGFKRTFRRIAREDPSQAVRYQAERTIYHIKDNGTVPKD